jgi:hypothetical protein
MLFHHLASFFSNIFFLKRTLFNFLDSLIFELENQMKVIINHD